MNRPKSNRLFFVARGILLVGLVLGGGSLLAVVASGDQQHLRAEGSAGTTTPPLAIAPFDAATARRHQASWSGYLDQSLEMTTPIADDVELKMALIPPGEFMMGSPESEEGRWDDESPQHRVRITRPFYLGVYPVTQSQWESVMGNNPSVFS